MTGLQSNPILMVYNISLSVEKDLCEFCCVCKFTIEGSWRLRYSSIFVEFIIKQLWV